ncbi:MAG: DUF2442 domain-containing protein [Flavobacteriales bacterium]|nr:DUF2442 domain-containing protein [Flavobacteriales bacterium]
MLRVEKILKIEPYRIVCLFNNGIEKAINVLPLIENHKHLNGIEQLKEPNVFARAKIGDFGEIVWESIIRNSKTNERWDYDISPEFIFYQKS